MLPERSSLAIRTRSSPDGFTVIHCTIAIRDAVDIRRVIEYEARLYSALEDVWHQLVHVGANWCRPAMVMFA